MNVMTITPRDLDVDFTDVPRAWMADNPVATAIANGVNMLFPAGERFFVRSVKHFSDDLDGRGSPPAGSAAGGRRGSIDDAVLRAQVKGFFGQEGRHAREHDRFNQVMRAQGFEIDRFLTFFERSMKRMERFAPPKLRLATTAAAEHFTAIMAEGAFTRGQLDAADPRMQQLLAWHAAEEIEHKAVAFDVLQRVDPSYTLRIAGLAVATTLLAGYWALATRMLLAQQGYTPRTALAELRTMKRADPIFKRVFGAGIRSYLRRDFHPDDHDQSELADAWFAAHGLAMPAAA